jgi:uncharacterized membrane-anchored protein YjiN (DUF445 family)
MKNNLGSISLLFAFSGLVFFELLMHLDMLTHSGWKIVIAGFEAATIGGFADWFAVRALFYEIPIPFIKKHTNIIVKNREKLTEGIVDLVTNKWLSPEVISEKLSEVDLASALLDFLQQPDSQKKSIGFIREIALKLSSELDNPPVVLAIQNILTKQIRETDLASPIGNWLEKAVKNGDHNKIWELLLEASENALNNVETKDLILLKLEEAIKEYSDKGLIKRATIVLAKKTGGINLNSITMELLDKTSELLAEAKSNPQHPIRVKFDDWIIEFAQNLKNGEENTLFFIENLKTRLADHIETENTIQNLLSNWKDTVSSQLENDETSLMQFLIANLNRLVNDLQNDAAAQIKINTWIKESISELLNKFHNEIGNMVRNSLIKLDNKELVEQIEGKVGNDLQYIRLNGAVVGGLVGIIIASIKLALN